MSDHVTVSLDQYDMNNNGVYHTDAQCHALKNAGRVDTISLEEATENGFRQCASCRAGEVEGVYSSHTNKQALEAASPEDLGLSPSGEVKSR